MTSKAEDFIDDFVIVEDSSPPKITLTEEENTPVEENQLETICETVAADIAKDLVKDVIFEHKPKEEVLKDIIHDVIEDVISHPDNNKPVHFNHTQLQTVINKNNTVSLTTQSIKPLWVLMAQLPRAARLVWRALEIYHDIHSDIRKLFIFYFGLRIATGYFIPISAFI